MKRVERVGGIAIAKFQAGERRLSEARRVGCAHSLCGEGYCHVRHSRVGLMWDGSKQYRLHCWLHGDAGCGCDGFTMQMQLHGLVRRMDPSNRKRRSTTATLPLLPLYHSISSRSCILCSHIKCRRAAPCSEFLWISTGRLGKR